MGAISNFLIDKSVNIWKQGGYPWSNYAERAGAEMKEATTKAAEFLTGVGGSVTTMEDYLAIIWNTESHLLGLKYTLGSNGKGYYGLSQLGNTALVNWNEKVTNSAAKITTDYIGAAKHDPAKQVFYASRVMAGHLFNHKVGRINPSDGSFTPPASYGIPDKHDLAVLYLSVLFPIYITEPDPNKPLQIGKQVGHLFENGIATKSTIVRGLCRAAKERGAPITECGGQIITTGSSTGDTFGGGVMGSSTSGGIIFASRSSAKDLPLSMAKAKVESGSSFSATAGFSQGLNGMGNTTGLPIEGGSTNAEGGINTNLAKGDIFVRPVEPQEIVTSNFGPRWGRLHAGVDYGTTTNEPVYSAAAGVVTFIGWIKGYGNVVAINHGPLFGGTQDIYTTYNHLNASLVKKGDKVLPGQHIAKTGATGGDYAPHLHFEIRLGSYTGKTVDPSKYVPNSRRAKENEQ
jgi:hypothetical protein